MSFSSATCPMARWTARLATMGFRKQTMAIYTMLRETYDFRRTAKSWSAEARQAIHRSTQWLRDTKPPEGRQSRYCPIPRISRDRSHRKHCRRWLKSRRAPAAPTRPPYGFPSSLRFHRETECRRRAFQGRPTSRAHPLEERPPLGAASPKERELSESRPTEPALRVTLREKTAITKWSGRCLAAR